MFVILYFGLFYCLLVDLGVCLLGFGCLLCVLRAWMLLVGVLVCFSGFGFLVFVFCYLPLLAVLCCYFGMVCACVLFPVFVVCFVGYDFRVCGVH